VIGGALFVSERGVGDGFGVVGWFWQGRSEVGRAHVRGTDGYIALGVWGRSVGSQVDGLRGVLGDRCPRPLDRPRFHITAVSSW